MNFYVFEGIKGCGKSSLIKAVYHRLDDLHYGVSVYRDPGGTRLGESIRKLLETEPIIDRHAAGYLYLAARSQLLYEKHLPKSEYLRQHIVLQDRWSPSTLAYQDKMFWPLAEDLDIVLPCKRVFWIDTNPAIAATRQMLRDNLESAVHQEEQWDRYFTLCKENEKWVQLNGMKSTEALTNEVVDIIVGDMQ